MRAERIPVALHSRKPVWALDFHPSGLLATGGGDNNIKFWKVTQDDSGGPAVRPVETVSTRTGAVTCVRFSPTGKQLASAGDGGDVFLWEPGSGHIAALDADEEAPDLGWRLTRSLRSEQAEDVSDMSWAPDATALLTGSTGNCCMVWDVRKGEAQVRLVGHGHYVQGVAWDPAQQYMVSQSADRTCRVYGLPLAALGKRGRASADTPSAMTPDLISQNILGEGLGPGAARQKLFRDDCEALFFRRLAWSPDGSMLVAPAGLLEPVGAEQGTDVTYVYARGRWEAPVSALPATKPTVAARFCPRLFELGQGRVRVCPLDLPYRMVFAVATVEAVSIYDATTQRTLAILGGLHSKAAPITDIAWSCDGQYMAVSAKDGYCSLVHFSEGELGTPLADDRMPAHIRHLIKAAAKAAAPATLERSVPARALRKSQPAGIAGGALQPDWSRSTLGPTASRAVPKAGEQLGQAAIPASPTGRPAARKRPPARERFVASAPARLHLTGATQGDPSRAPAPLPRPAQSGQTPVSKRSCSEAPLGQQLQAERVQPDSAARKRKRMDPAFAASAPAAVPPAISGRSAAERESARPRVPAPGSGLGQAEFLAELAARRTNAGSKLWGVPVKRASLEQLTAIMALACSEGGFCTVNTHLSLHELAGLGWVALQPLLDEPAMGQQALAASIATLVCLHMASDKLKKRFKVADLIALEYEAVLKQALRGEALEMLRDFKEQGNRVPEYLTYGHVKVPTPDGKHRRPMILVYLWRGVLIFPDKPVFHAQPVNHNPQSQYGALNTPPRSVFPKMSDPELADTKNLKLHLVGAVYGAKLAWAMEHGGEEPSDEVVAAWGPMQASHLLEGAIGLRRNFCHRFLTLEREGENQSRHSCARILLRKLAGGLMPAASALERDDLVESQLMGSQPLAGAVSLEDGNQMLLERMLAAQVETERFFKEEIVAKFCAGLHPHAPCRFWQSSFGAVPAATLRMHINDSILARKLLLWPPELQMGGPAWVPPAEREIVAVNWDEPKTIHQAKQKEKYIAQETGRVTAVAIREHRSRKSTDHRELNLLRFKKSAMKATMERLQDNVKMTAARALRAE